MSLRLSWIYALPPLFFGLTILYALNFWHFQPHALYTAYQEGQFAQLLATRCYPGGDGVPASLYSAYTRALYAAQPKTCAELEPLVTQYGGVESVARAIEKQQECLDLWNASTGDPTTNWVSNGIAGTTSVVPSPVGRGITINDGDPAARLSGGQLAHCCLATTREIHCEGALDGHETYTLAMRQCATD